MLPESYPEAWREMTRYERIVALRQVISDEESRRLAFRDWYFLPKNVQKDLITLSKESLESKLTERSLK